MSMLKDLFNGSGLKKNDLKDNEEQLDEKIPVIEEQLTIEKRVVETGKVQISKEVHEEEVLVNSMIATEEVNIERVPVNRYVVSTPPSVRHEGDTIIIPVLREVAVVEKRLMVVEELHVTKKRTESPVSEKVTLKKEEVTVRRVDPEATSGQGVR